MDKKHSIIQSTLIRITILMFSILLFLYFIIAGIYWDKEVLQRKFELLSIASTVEMQVQTHYLNINKIKESEELDYNGKKKAIESLLQNSLEDIPKNNPSTLVGFYYTALNLNVSKFSKETDNLSIDINHQELSSKIIESGGPEFIFDSKVLDWDGKGVIAVTVPVFHDNQIIGHTWAMVSSGHIIYNSYLKYSRLFIPSIILWILVLVLIKRSITQIKSSLDTFTEKIIKDKFDDNEDLEQLPELKPVFTTIRTHLDNLHELNNRLEDTNDKLLTIMEGISDGFFSLDRHWRFTFVNKETKELVNRQDVDLIGKEIWQEMPEMENPDTVMNLTDATMMNTPRHWETQSLINGKYYEFHAYPFAKGLTVFFRDITNIKHRENELLRLERLNLIGQMAAGISHEVRNPLTTVRGFLQMMEGRSDSEQNKEYMEIMISEIDRANGIITDFLSLAKANADSTKNESINEIINRISPMLQADAFNSNKEVIINLEEVPDLQLNDSEIKQLTLNLVRNGLEETPEGGKVYISTILEDDFVVLAIKDEGKGIPLEVQDKLGTPFVTTKDTGTGLGLAISIGIAHRHKAKFEYETGQCGTTFYIKFPLETKI